ncbi:ninjurin-A [Achroia grisella]|uniref:ninjurin-A n=1 Tax=Achroia grisella TaxID=688607 RepID=UPI0027D29AB2|nr:ninjurin-A [Achroia grisella]
MSHNDIVLNIERDNKNNIKVDPAIMEMVFGTPNKPKSDGNRETHSIGNSKRSNESHSPKSTHKSEVESSHPRLPLLEPDKDTRKLPLAESEIDDIDDERPENTGPYPGIDDGLLDPDGTKPEGGDHHTEDGPHDTHDEGVGTDDGKRWLFGHDEPDYIYGINGTETRFGVDDRPGSPLPGVIPDVNTYQQKKNLAQGMMDLALLSANANQLRYVIETSSGHPYYYSSVTFITLSIILQIGVGIGLILNSRYNVKDEKDICKADKINNMTVLGIFLITIVNVFITSFSVAPTSTGVVPTVAVQQPAIQQAG